ncbi:MAG: ferredoxin [Bdellovibrionales bacterium GWB1_55_8]|nr:MAG: ferredoxin [Bdellovibrionales bacterium GWB1_55_8]
MKFRYLRNVSLQYLPEKCNGCQRCVEVCPREVFAFENKRAVLHDREACMECGACMKNCEAGALSVSAGVGCAAAIINGMIRGGEPSCGCDKSGCC